MTEFILDTNIAESAAKKETYGTLSLVAGPDVCNAHCPFCIARMVPSKHVERKSNPINKLMLKKALEMATSGGSDTVLITGNGEPTIFPDQITTYLEEVKKFEASSKKSLRKELQTNGILLAQSEKHKEHLVRWAELGLKTIAISVSHYDPEKNREIYTPNKKEYIDLPSLISQIKAQDIRVRLTLVMMKGYIDSVEEVEKMLSFCKENNVDEVSLLPVNKPDISYDPEVSNWVDNNRLSDEQRKIIQTFIEDNSTLIETFGFGARVYNFGGQIVCTTDCVAKMPDGQGQRRLIFYPNGAISHDWNDKETIFDPSNNTNEIKLFGNSIKRQ